MQKAIEKQSGSSQSGDRLENSAKYRHSKNPFYDWLVDFDFHGISEDGAFLIQPDICAVLGCEKAHPLVDACRNLSRDEY
jgi:hypothetical protein